MSYLIFLNSLIGAVSLAHREKYDFVLALARSVNMSYAHSTWPLHYRTLAKCRMTLFSIRWLELCHLLILRHTTFYLSRLDQSTWPMHYRTLAKCRMSIFLTRWFSFAHSETSDILLVYARSLNMSYAQSTLPLHHHPLAKFSISLFSNRWLDQCHLIILRHTTFCLRCLDHSTWCMLTQRELGSIVLLQNVVCRFSQFADWSSVNLS